MKYLFNYILLLKLLPFLVFPNDELKKSVYKLQLWALRGHERFLQIS